MEDADGYVTTALFNLGVSIRDVESKKVSQRENRGVSGEFKDMRVNLPRGVTEEKVIETLIKSLSKPYFEHDFKRGENSVTLEVEVYNVLTHKLQFDFYKETQIERLKGVVKEKESSTPLKEQAKVGEEKPPIKKTEGKAFKEKQKPKVVIIVDDLGLNKGPIDRLLELPASLNFAILPNLPYSEYAAEMAHRKGWDVILHLPMEAKRFSGHRGGNAEDGTLLVKLPKGEILTKLDRSLTSIPYLKGVNNHMGSRFTEDGELMELVLKRVQTEGLFFIDSRTSENTTGHNVAKRLGVKTAQRDVFLDGGLQGENYIRSQIQKLIDISKEKGYAVGICHPYPDTLAVLSDVVPKMKEEVDIVPASRIVN